MCSSLKSNYSVNVSNCKDYKVIYDAITYDEKSAQREETKNNCMLVLEHFFIFFPRIGQFIDKVHPFFFLGTGRYAMQNPPELTVVDLTK